VSHEVFYNYTMNYEIIAAIQNKNLIEMVYEDKYTVVKPYCYGVTTDNVEYLIAIPVEGFIPKQQSLWQGYDIDKADDMNVLKETFLDVQKDVISYSTELRKVYAAL
jgi:hypothetical protein